MAQSGLIGRKIGRWSIIGSDPQDNKRCLCICDCGTKRSVSRHSLRANRTFSCGCLQKEAVAEIAKDLRGIDENDIIGQRFSRLMVTSVEDKDKYGQWQYGVICDCGVQFTVVRQSLISGKTQSCGCLNAELTSKRTTQRFRQLREDRGLDPDLKIKGEINYIRAIIKNHINQIIIEIDGHRCMNCGKRKPIEVHHIIPLMDFLKISEIDTYEMAYSLKNLISLCKDCHSIAHNYCTRETNRAMQKELLEIIEIRNLSIVDKLMDEYNKRLEQIVVPLLKKNIAVYALGGGSGTASN